MGAQRGATSASPLMVTHMIHGFERPFVFITPPRQLAVAASQFRATQANLGQNERKEFQEESFFGTRRNKGAWFGYKEQKLKSGRRLPTATFSTVAWVQRWSGIHNMSESWKRRNWKDTGKSKVQSFFKHPFFFFPVLTFFYNPHVCISSCCCLCV